MVARPRARRLALLGVLLAARAVADGDVRLSGTVRELGSRRPVAGAEVTAGDGPAAAVTDRAGLFVLDSLPAGTLEVRIAAWGYRILRERVTLTRSSEARVFDLPPDFGAVQEVDVVAPAPREAGRRALARSEIRAVPGTGGDPLRAVTALPGVSPSSDADSNLYVRGGGPNDNAIYADGIPAGYPYHYQGVASTFQADAIESLEFYTGGFPARFGDRMGGIFDLETRRVQADRLTGSVGISLIASALTVEAPVPLAGGGALVSLRRGYFDFVLPRRVTDVAVPRYDDYLVTWTRTLGDADTLRLESFGAEDEAIAEVRSAADPTLTGEFSWHHAYHVGAATWSHRLAAGEATLSAGGNLTRNAVDLGQGYFFDQHPEEAFLRQAARWRTGSHEVRAGLEGAADLYKLDAYFARLPTEGQGTYAFTSLSKIRTTQHSTGGRAAGWASDRCEPVPGASLEAGARLDWYRLTGTVVPSPRASGRLTLAPGVRLLGSGGLYLQSPQALELMRVWGNPRLEPSRAWHALAGLEWERGPWLTTVEGYDKEFLRLVTPDPATNYANAGSGWARGADVLVRRNFSERVAGWAGYAWGITRRRDRPGLALRPSDYDIPHAVSLVGRALLTPDWTVSARWRLASGTPFTPVTGVHRDAAGETVPEFGAVNSARLPAYHRLDVRAEYLYRASGWSLAPYVELLNAYNHQNLAAVVYSTNFGDNRRIRQLPHAYYFGVDLRF